MKRFIATFMTLCLVLGLSSVSAWAAEANKWKDEPNMPIEQYNLASCVIGDNIYVLGGPYSNAVAIYNTKNKSWKIGEPMPQIANLTKAVSIGNKIYAIGPKGTNTYTDFAAVMQIYDVSTNKWTVETNIPIFHEILGVIAIGEKIYVVNSNVLKNKTSVLIYDTVSKEWSSSKSSCSEYKVLAGICSLDNNLYVVGGLVGSNSSNLVEVYNTETDTWKTVSSLPTSRSQLTAEMVGSKMYVIGGYESGAGNSNKVEIYDTETNSWTSGVLLKTPLRSMESTVLNGKIYIFGGSDQKTQKLNTVQSLQVGDSLDDSTLKLSVLLNEGETVQLSTSFDLDNNKNFTWSSTNEAVAKVDANGKVTAVAEGTADIYAQNADGTFKEYIPVKVVKGVADELRLAVHLKTGEKAKLYLTDDSSKVTWSSVDSSIATVATDGQVTGVKKGLVIVKAEMDGQSYQIYVRVNG